MTVTQHEDKATHSALGCRWSHSPRGCFLSCVTTGWAIFKVRGFSKLEQGAEVWLIIPRRTQRPQVFTSNICYPHVLDLLYTTGHVHRPNEPFLLRPLPTQNFPLPPPALRLGGPLPRQPPSCSANTFSMKPSQLLQTVSRSHSE